MSEYGGFLIHFDESGRNEKLHETLIRDGRFSDALSATDWKPQEFEIGFISWDGETIRHACLMKRGRRVVSIKYRIEFLRFVEFTTPVSFGEIKRVLGDKIQSFLTVTSKGSGIRLKPSLWASLFQLFQSLRPETADVLDDLEKARTMDSSRFKKEAFKIVAEEKDATSLALEIAGIDRKVLSQEFDLTNYTEPAPFLRGVRQAKIREDTMILHDAQTVPGWERVRDYQIGATEFRNNTGLLTVMNVNRTTIEQTLGVDLLYYNHRYHGFILVQYKRMTRDSSSLKLAYRPTDKSYFDEVSRIRHFKSKHASSFAAHPTEYRLNPECFFIKLCDEVTFSPLSNELISGMYFPFEHWERLENSKDVRGPRGGLLFSYETVDRYMTNSFFISLLQGSWIGSFGATSEAISALVGELLDANHSVIYAIESAARR